MRTHADKLKEIPFIEPNQDLWPDHVREIALGEIGRLGIDRDRSLYWDGRQIEIKRRLALSDWQKTGAVLVTVFTVVGGLGSAAQGWMALHPQPTVIQVQQTTDTPNSAPERPESSDPGPDPDEQANDLLNLLSI